MATDLDLHEVTEDEMQNVNKWLEGHLPASWQACEFFHSIGQIHLFAPDSKDVEQIINCPSIIDWNQKEYTFDCVTDGVRSVIEKIAQQKNYGECHVHQLIMMKAEPGAVKTRQIPDGYELRKLDPEVDVNHCTSVYNVCKPGASDYFKSLIRNMPNACISESGSKKIVTFEIGSECAEIRWLHTMQEHRGKGLGKALVCHLANEYFKHNLPCIAFVGPENMTSYKLHEGLGFKEICKTNVMTLTSKGYQFRELYSSP